MTEVDWMKNNLNDLKDQINVRRKQISFLLKKTIKHIFTHRRWCLTCQHSILIDTKLPRFASISSTTLIKRLKVTIFRSAKSTFVKTVIVFFFGTYILVNEHFILFGISKASNSYITCRMRPEQISTFFLNRFWTKTVKYNILPKSNNFHLIYSVMKHIFFLLECFKLYLHMACSDKSSATSP